MNYNYHTHTFRCHHATGTEREYIEEAIKNGIVSMGFSEHIPFVLPDGTQSSHRIYMRETELYFLTLNELRNEYKNEIEIFIGFESEFYPKYYKKMIGDMIDMGAEYMILGQHLLYNEYPNQVVSGSPKNGYNELKDYTDAVISGMESGYFTYVAHPDLINFSGDEQLYTEEMTRLCKKSTSLNIPLEINFLGIRTNRRYPLDKFWEIAGREKSPVTFGIDAHDAKSAGDIASVQKAMELVEKHNLNYIGKPNLILLNK